MHEEETLIRLIIDSNHIIQEVVYEVVKLVILYPIAKIFWNRHHSEHHKEEK